MNRLYRWFAKQWVCWWADSELPAWLRSLAPRGEAFRRGEQELDTFEARLRSDASAWAAAESSPASMSVRSSNRKPSPQSLSRTWHVAISVGLVAAASFALFVAMRPQQPTSPNRQKLSRQTPYEDVQQATNEFQALTTVFADSLSGIDSSISSLSSATNSSFDVADRKRLHSAIKQPLESFSRGYGKAIAFIAKHHVPVESP